MEVKEKIMSKEDILKLIDDSKIKEVFEAIKTHEGKYNESMYENLKRDFINNKIGIDYFDRLRLFIDTLREDKKKQDIKAEINNYTHLILNTEKLKAAINRVKFFEYAGTITMMISVLSFFIYDYEIKILDFIPFIPKVLFILFLSQGFIFISSFLLKGAEVTYQILVTEVTYSQDFSFFTSTQIAEAKNILVKFVDLKKFNLRNSTLHITLLISLGVALLSYFLKEKNKGIDNIKNSLSPQTYIYSPSFDSLLQNDKKVYQYVDSLVQKHKK